MHQQIRIFTGVGHFFLKVLHHFPAHLYEPPCDKTNKMTVRPAKTQISLGIRVFAVSLKKAWVPGWSESSLGAVILLVLSWERRLNYLLTQCLKEMLRTVKLQKFWTPKTFAVITLKFELGGFTVEYWMHPKDADSMARSSLSWVYTVCSGLSVRKLRNITVGLEKWP